MDTLLTRYMLAHLRLNGAQKPETWDPSDVVEVFALLPQPATTFPQWCARLGLNPEVPRKDENLTDEERAAANDASLPAFVGALESAGAKVTVNG
jgi:hypothetical protein